MYKLFVLDGNSYSPIMHDVWVPNSLEMWTARLFTQEIFFIVVKTFVGPVTVCGWADNRRMVH